METPTRYKLQVRLEIVKEDWNGSVSPEGMPLEDQGGYWGNRNNERLSVNEDLNLGSMDFLGVMDVLGKLHHSLVELKANEPKS